MSEASARRLDAMTGLAFAAAIAAWWLGSTRLALEHGSDAGRSAAEALQALLLVRVAALAMISIRVGTLRGWRPGVMSGMGLITPSWPVVILVWSAGTASATQVAMAEVLLLAGSVALPLVGMVLRRWLQRTELAVITGTVLGIAFAASVWAARDLCCMPSP